MLPTSRGHTVSAAGPIHRKTLIAIAVVAFCLRLLMLFDTGGWGNEESLIARHIAAGEGFQGPSLYGDEIRPTSQKPPGPAALLALSFLMAPSFPHAGFIVLQAIAATLGCWWLARLGEVTLGPRVGVTAAVMAALFVPHIWWMRHFGEQIFAAAGMVGTLLLLYRADRSDRTVDAAVWGASLGLCGYFISDVLLAAAPSALWFAWRRREPGVAQALQKPAIAALVALAVLAPWTVRNFDVHQEFVLVRTGFGTALWWGNNPQATGTDWFLIEDDGGLARRVSGRYAMPEDLFGRLTALSEVEQERLLTDVAWRWMRDNPTAAAQLWVRKLYYYWWFNDLNDAEPVPIARDAAWAAVLLCFMLGVLGVVRNRIGSLAPLFFPLVTSSLLHATTVVSANWRMRIPIEPIVLLLAAYGLLSVDAALRRRFGVVASSSALR